MCINSKTYSVTSNWKRCMTRTLRIYHDYFWYILVTCEEQGSHASSRDQLMQEWQSVECILGIYWYGKITGLLALYNLANIQLVTCTRYYRYRNMVTTNANIMMFTIQVCIYIHICIYIYIYICTLMKPYFKEKYWGRLLLYSLGLIYYSLSQPTTASVSYYILSHWQSLMPSSLIRV